MPTAHVRLDFAVSKTPVNLRGTIWVQRGGSAWVAQGEGGGNRSLSLRPALHRRVTLGEARLGLATWGLRQAWLARILFARFPTYLSCAPASRSFPVNVCTTIVKARVRYEDKDSRGGGGVRHYPV